MTAATIDQHGSTVDWVFLWLLALMGLGCVPGVWRLWVRGERLHWRRHDYSAAQRADVERGALWAFLGVLAFVVFGVLAWVPAPALYQEIGAVICGPVALVCILLMLSLHYLGRPRWAVPPVMRDVELSRELAHFDRAAHRALHAVIRAQRADRRTGRRTHARSRSLPPEARWARIESDARTSARRWRRVGERLQKLVPPAPLLTTHEQMILAVTRREHDRWRRADAIHARISLDDLRRGSEPGRLRDAHRDYLRALRAIELGTDPDSPTPATTQAEQPAG